MDGKPVFKWAVRMLVASIGDVLDQTGLTVGDVDLFVLHQANIRILDAAAKEIGIDPAKMVVNLDRYGNTSSGSIPLALDECVAAGTDPRREPHRAERIRRRVGLGNWVAAVVSLRPAHEVATRE